MTFQSLCRSSALLQITIFQAFIWTANLITFIGTTLYIPYLPKFDLFINGSIMAVVMIVGIFFGSWLSHRVRKG